MSLFSFSLIPDKKSVTLMKPLLSLPRGVRMPRRERYGLPIPEPLRHPLRTAERCQLSDDGLYPFLPAEIPPEDGIGNRRREMHLRTVAGYQPRQGIAIFQCPPLPFLSPAVFSAGQPGSKAHSYHSVKRNHS